MSTLDRLEAWSRLTLYIDEEFLGLHLKVLLGARPDLANPLPGVSQLQIGHPYRAIIVGVSTPPGNPAPLDVDALSDDVGVEVGRLPAAEMHLAVRGAVEDDVVSDLLHGAGKRLRGGGQ